MENEPEDIAIVGPCAAGKSTLVQGLLQRGYCARQIAQEHSYVPQMWRLIRRPDLLIYLDASFPTCTQRKALNWSRVEYEEQLRRLGHARKHCDLYIDTDGYSISEVLQHALDWLESREFGKDPD